MLKKLKTDKNFYFNIILSVIIEILFFWTKNITSEFLHNQKLYFEIL